MRLIGIDFEYGNGTAGSICRYGFAFEDGSVESDFVQLHESCNTQERTKYHTVTQEQTDGGIDFAKLYARIAELNGEEPTVFVAHDLKSDRRSWLAAQRLFGFDTLPLIWADSLVLARAELGLDKTQGGAGIAAMAERYGLSIEHHHPADDAKVSLAIAMANGLTKNLIEDIPTKRRRRAPRS